MTDTDNTPTEEELEEKYSDEPEYTLRLNGKVYELNKDARKAIQDRARHEYAENSMFTCFWKQASPEQYADGEWQETIHEQGDPVLVIETEGSMVPWERMDKLQVEMQEVGPQSQLDRQMDRDDDSKPDERDNGNGLKTIDPSDVDDDDEPEKQIGRTHFGITPQQFEEVPSPDGEEPDKIPPKPIEMDEDPALVKWIPEHPDIDHSWAAGEAICSMYNRVEWNVQAKVDQPRLDKNKDNSHDHWKSLLGLYDCEVVSELAPSQRPPTDTKEPRDPSDDDVADKFEDGIAGGDNWRV
jgi:hypothetical protein